MNEQKEKEIEVKAKKRKKWNGEKKFYLLTALGSALALVAVVVIAVAASSGGSVDKNQANNGGNNGDNTQNEQPANPDDKPTSSLPEGMIAPVETVSVLNDHGFFHDKTMDCYYAHQGVDFTAEAGTEVLAVEDGVVESIYTGDLLVGTEIVIDHGDGLKSVYRFVDEADGLKVGKTVQKGEVIATVAEANGGEYKEGTHLHFEVRKDGKSVDPAIYLTLEEK